ncbi:hypothetical protein MVEG_01950 [Podila verticillata NRRL 6337]|nr:hypothetical protein MVEG_01950 [Podila verticillata NRRL 6337]
MLLFIILCVSLFMCWSHWGKVSARHRRVVESEILKVAAMPSEMQDLQYNSGTVPAMPPVVQNMKPPVKLNLAAGPTSGTSEVPLPHRQVSFSEEQIKDGTLQPAISGVPEIGDTNTRLPPSHPPQRRYSMAEWVMQQRRDCAIDQAFAGRIGYSRSNTHRTEHLCGIAPGAPRRAGTFGGVGHGS